MVDWMKSLYLFSDNLGDNIADRFNNLFYKKLYDVDKRLLLIEDKENKAEMTYEKNIIINSFFGYASEIEYYSAFNFKEIREILDYFGITYESIDGKISFYNFYCYIDDNTADIKVVANSIMENNYFLNAFIDFVVQKRIVNKLGYMSSSLLNKFLHEFNFKYITDGPSSDKIIKK